MKQIRKLIAISGTTCSGKSSLALDIAAEFESPIIVNFDSRQIYKDIPIASAQPTLTYTDQYTFHQGVRHELYGFVDSDVNYSVYDFMQDFRQLLNTVQNEQVILVGGTGLYLRAALYNYKPLEGKSSSTPIYDTVHASILEEGGKYEERLKKRIQLMTEAGLESEAKSVIKKFKNKQVYNTLGIKEFDRKEGEYDLDEIQERVFINTRQYAKRQRTWFRNQAPEAEKFKSKNEAKDYLLSNLR